MAAYAESIQYKLTALTEAAPLLTSPIDAATFLSPLFYFFLAEFLRAFDLWDFIYNLIFSVSGEIGNAEMGSEEESWRSGVTGRWRQVRGGGKFGGDIENSTLNRKIGMNRSVLFYINFE
ncbi:hypothetical protein J6590_001405 [Homalodisca vitripennis]|nr:hypothetical protein J6590_001405 [Homalodisca vitripennis]